MISKIKYLYSKVVLYLQIPSIKSSDLHKTCKIGHRSNVINLKMGKYSYLGSNSSINNVSIGNFCSIASYCAIGGDSHPISYVSTSPIFYNQKSSLKENFSSDDIIHQSKVIIGNDVWIGEKCFIKSGVKIGNGAIIGAHSVVTKDVPDFSVVAGTPAKLIKYRFSEEIIQNLSLIEWWNFSESDLKKYAKFFNDPKKFVEIYNSKNKVLNFNE